MSMTAATSADGGPRGGRADRRAWSARRTVTLALLPGSVFLAAFVWRAASNPYGPRRFTLFDDAMISMTYARTLADTGEWVWYPGADRVQGVTNPLWTLYMAGLHVIGLRGSGAALAVSVTGIVLVLASASLVFVLVHRGLGSDRTATFVGAAAAGTVPFVFPFTFWTLRGMEVGLLAVLLLSMIAATPASTETGDGNPFIATTAAIVGILTRLDFVIFVAIIAALSGWRSSGRRRTHALVLASVAAGAVMLTLVFQQIYWGDWLPNTYRLKMEGYSVWQRLVRGLVSLGKTLPLLVGVGLAVDVTRRLGTPAQRRRSVQLAAVVAGAAVYEVWVGGDAWESFLYTSRYVSVALPAAVALIFLAAGAAIRASTTSARTRWLLALVPAAAVAAGLVSNPYRFHVPYAIGMFIVSLLVVCALAGSWSTARAGASRSSFLLGAIAIAVVALTGAYPYLRWAQSGGLHVADDQQKTEEGVQLADATSPDAAIAVGWAGAPAYYSERPMVDLLGKSDPVIAGRPPVGPFYPGHNKFDYDYSVGVLRPDVVVRQTPSQSPLGRRFGEWGYARRCLELRDGERVAAYFLVDSPHLEWAVIRTC